MEADEAVRFAGATVAIFGTDTTEAAPLDRIQRHVHVALFDRASRAEYVYSAMILHSGLLAASDAAAGGLSFSPRRYAFRHGRCFASIGPERHAEQTILHSARYFVTLRLGDLQPHVTTEIAPERDVCVQTVTSDDSPLPSRLDADAIQHLFRGRAPRVKRAMVDTANVDHHASTHRRSAADHPLVAMRMLRRA